MPQCIAGKRQPLMRKQNRLWWEAKFSSIDDH
jgi:hypothetical protein